MINPIDTQSLLDSINIQGSTAKESTFAGILNEAVNKKDDVLLKQTCKDLESVMVSIVLRSMRATVPKDSLYGDSLGTDVFTSMLDDEYAKKISDAGGFGLADMLYKQLSGN